MSLVILIIILAISGCSKQPPRGLNPVETVQYYFEQWGNKSPAGMNSVLYKKDSIFDFREGLRGLKNIKLDSCELGERPNDWYDAWYADPYDYAVVNTKFEIEFHPFDSVMANGTYHWEFYLIKEKADSDWRLIMWGSG